MAVITAVAEFERDLIIERTQAGLARAVAAGAVLGRKPKLDSDQKAAARAQLAAGASISAVAKSLNVSRLTVICASPVRSLGGPTSRRQAPRFIWSRQQLTASECCICHSRSCAATKPSLMRRSPLSLPTRERCIIVSKTSSRRRATSTSP